MHVVGTAGHVDHGKSSLVHALTGTNPDRWLEERERGMTLDLGFAHLRFDDGFEAGIVDVPGHERFLHNMLAGAAGMELLLLVVAADDGVMPQTLEHLQILRFLNVKRTIVAVTKIDLVPAEQAGAVCKRTHEQLAGTIAEDAGVFAVSTVTGYQLGVLAEALHQELAALPERDADAPLYMPVDRVFTLPGRGTIVTGTLMQGRIATGESVTITPPRTAARVRSLHVFGSARDEAGGGARVALNLPSLDRDAVARGAVIADPAFAARAAFDVRFTALPEAEPLLRRRTPVRAYIGSAEILGTLVRGDADKLILRQPVVAFPGVRFVLRRVSPKTLLGGGEIVASFEALDDAGENVDAVRAALERAALVPQSLAELAFATNLREDVVAGRIEELVEQGVAVAIARPNAYLDAVVFAALGVRAREELAAFESREPWALGMTSQILARVLAVDEPLLVRLLLAIVEDGRIAQRHGYYATLEHQPKLSAEQRAFFEAAVPYDVAQPFLPADFAEVAEAVKTVQIPGLRRAFDTLLARGVLVKIDAALYRGTQVEGAHERLATFIGSHGSVTPAQLRDVLGTSRKYVVPLLEWFDARGITVRSGDVRVLRKKAGA
jgi:selenocysteine-specific elongation factor